MHLFSVGLDVTKARETAFITLGVRHATQKRSTFANEVPTGCRDLLAGLWTGYCEAMPDSAYALFIEDCRQERAHLAGLIEALEGIRISPGARISIPGPLIAPTATLVAFQKTVAELNALIDAYDAGEK
jgi:hypothetical protein